MTSPHIPLQKLWCSGLPPNSVRQAFLVAATQFFHNPPMLPKRKILSMSVRGIISRASLSPLRTIQSPIK